ncbi:hypothetical protein V6Z12_D04G024600 [Gossypium hirsutum]
MERYLLHCALCSLRRARSFRIQMLQRLFNKTGYLFPSYFPQLIPRFYLLLIEARTACDVWNTATHLFVVVTSTKLSRLRHDLHLIKKWSLSVKEYIAKIQNTSASKEASGS